MHTILIADDDKLLQDALTAHLEAEGYTVFCVDDGAAALQAIDEGLPDALILDVRMGEVGGLEVLRRVRILDEGLPVFVISAHAGADYALGATELGATAYLAKPFSAAELAERLRSALQVHEQDLLDERDARATADDSDEDGDASLPPAAAAQPEAQSSSRSRRLPARPVEHERRPARDEIDVLPEAERYADLVAASPAMKSVFETLRQLEQVDAPTVLITGESGTGKELVARAIHARGPRRHAPYVEVDCVAMPDTLIESELFGHEKGSFTDARQLKRGLFEVVRGGVLFLDEIGEMQPMTQAKLLRALENRRFKRVGGVVELPLDAAVIAATNRNLQDEVKAGRFREDLFFRLNVVPVQVPPLRVRGDDVAVLAEHLLEKCAGALGRSSHGITDAALAVLCRYDWPGNVRELRNVVERALILKKGGGPIGVEDLPLDVRRDPPAAQSAPTFVLPPGGVELAAVERSLVEQAVLRAGGNRTRAAKLLGISRFALRYRLEKFGLEHDGPRDVR